MINQSVNYTVHDFRMKTKSYTQFNMGSNHFHNSYEMYYLLSGTRDYFINDQTIRIKAGDLVLIKPYVLHKTIDTGESHSRLLLSFKPRYLPFNNIDKLLENVFTDNYIITFDANTRSNIESIYINMIADINEKREFFECSLQSHLLRLLILLNDYTKKQDKASNDLPPINEKIYEIVQYINSHYTEKITLADLSDKFYISKYYLSHTFKKITGNTVLKYIQNLKIIKSQQLLCDTDMKVIEIAQAVGFSNISNFGKAFKAITGVSPKNYRSRKEI